MKGELVKSITEDELILTGFYIEGAKEKPAILHIHGFEGDFYSNLFIEAIGTKLEENNHAFLTVQTRGTSPQQCLLNTKGGWIYTGSYFETLEEAYKDIDCWIKFLIEKGYKQIILQGHSLGTIKIMRYLKEVNLKEYVTKLILLAPFDKTWLFMKAASDANKTTTELAAAAKAKIKEGKGNELAPNGFDDVPHTYANFLSWATEDELGRMFDFYNSEYNFPYLKSIEIPVAIFVGRNDEFFYPSDPDNFEKGMEILLTNIKNSEGLIIPETGHSFAGAEQILSENILKFIHKSV